MLRIKNEERRMTNEVFLAPFSIPHSAFSLRLKGAINGRY
jgi:hypothetical protein